MPSPRDPYELAAAAATALAEATSCRRHDAVVVLGSGWASAADAFGVPAAELPMADLPGFHPPVADGHLGLVRSYVLGDPAPGDPAPGDPAPRDPAPGDPAPGEARVLCFLGRTHLYEGLGVDPVAHAVRTAAASGCRIAVLTNANGALRPDWSLGTGVVISDHLNLSGASPLRGPRFVDLSECWSPRLRRLALEAEPDLVEGVYAFLPGPHYETPAEARAYRALGADVLGMSTVVEAIAAREVGLELLGLSVVTAMEAVTAIEIGGGATDPAEVVAVAEASAGKLGTVIRSVLEQVLITCHSETRPSEARETS